MSVKITVVGAGHVGATTAQRVAELGIANEVALIDRITFLMLGLSWPKHAQTWRSLPF